MGRESLKVRIMCPNLIYPISMYSFKTEIFEYIAVHSHKT